MSLPNGYKRLDYIESSGTQYIDTGVAFGNNYKVDADVYLFANSTTVYWGFYGAYTDYSNIVDLFWNNNSLIVNETIIANISSYVSKKIKILHNNNNFYIDGTLISSSIPVYSSILSSYIFDFNSNGSPQQRGTKARVYAFKIFINSTLVRDYLPALRESDNSVGLYDLVNNQFYENQGTGSFDYGHILEENIELTDNPISFNIQEDVEFDVNFKRVHNILMKIGDDAPPRGDIEVTGGVLSDQSGNTITTQ